MVNAVLKNVFLMIICFSIVVVTPPPMLYVKLINVKIGYADCDDDDDDYWLCKLITSLMLMTVAVVHIIFV